MLRALKNALLVFLLLGVVCGGVYPMLVTLVGQKLFPEQSRGSVVYKDGVAVGSALIAQDWTRPWYFHGRPTANLGGANNAMMSGGTNDGPTSTWLVGNVRGRVKAVKEENPGQTGPIPQDLVTASGSGLDPHISPEAAAWQVPRVAKARGIPEEDLRKTVRSVTEKPVLHYLGQKRVNVLRLNMELDRRYPMAASPKPPAGTERKGGNRK